MASKNLGTPRGRARVVILGGGFGGVYTALPGADFSALANGLSEFRGEFEQIARLRDEADAEQA
jgi:hypothetical protein